MARWRLIDATCVLASCLGAGRAGPPAAADQADLIVQNGNVYAGVDADAVAVRGNTILTFGSDWGVATLDPLQGMWLAATRLAPAGMRDQHLSMADAMNGYTSWAAYASFEEQRKGTLAPGMLAGIIVLSRESWRSRPCGRRMSPSTRRSSTARSCIAARAALSHGRG